MLVQSYSAQLALFSAFALAGTANAAPLSGLIQSQLNDRDEDAPSQGLDDWTATEASPYARARALLDLDVHLLDPHVGSSPNGDVSILSPVYPSSSTTEPASTKTLASPSLSDDGDAPTFPTSASPDPGDEAADVQPWKRDDSDSDSGGGGGSLFGGSKGKKKHNVVTQPPQDDQPAPSDDGASSSTPPPPPSPPSDEPASPEPSVDSPRQDQSASSEQPVDPTTQGQQ